MNDDRQYHTIHTHVYRCIRSTITLMWFTHNEHYLLCHDTAYQLHLMNDSRHDPYSAMIDTQWIFHGMSRHCPSFAVLCFTHNKYYNAWRQAVWLHAWDSRTMNILHATHYRMNVIAKIHWDILICIDTQVNVHTLCLSLYMDSNMLGAHMIQSFVRWVRLWLNHMCTQHIWIHV